MSADARVVIHLLTLKCGSPVDKEPSREEIKLAERMASILKDFEARQLEVDEDERLEVVEEEEDWDPQHELMDVERQASSGHTITFSGGTLVSEERAATIEEHVKNSGKVSFDQRNDHDDSIKPPRPEPSWEAHHAAAQGHEERADTRLLERILKSLGIGWLSSCSEPPLSSTAEEEEQPKGENSHRLDMFWEMDLESAHGVYLVVIMNYGLSMQASFPSTTKDDWKKLGGYRIFTKTNLYVADVFYSQCLNEVIPLNQCLANEVLHLACYYVAHAVSKCHITKRELGDLCVAAVRLAGKPESKHSFCSKKFHSKQLDRLESQVHCL